MKTPTLLLAVYVASIGCVAPVNLTFESSRTLPKGNLDVQGNFSVYGYPGKYGGTTNLNFGAKVGYGISENYTLKFRYEHLYAPDITIDFDLFTDDSPAVPVELNYYELENKFRLGNGHALGITVGYYSTDIFTFDPRYYLTFPNVRNTFEFSVIPKVHVFFGKSTSYTPGLSLGAGFSSDLDRWAIRPEIGWDGYFSAGVALTFNLSGKGVK